MTTPRSILVRTPNWIGDQVLARPFFTLLRRHNPSAHIAVLCVPWVESLQYRDLVDAVHPLPAPDGSPWAKVLAHRALGRSLASARAWDLAILLPNSLSSALAPFWARARNRRGYALDGRSWLLTERVDWAPARGLHRAEAYARLAAAPGTWTPELQTEFEAACREPVDLARAFSAPAPAGLPSTSYWVLAPGSTAETRRWPVERFAKLAAKAAEMGLQGLVVGGPAERELAQKLCKDPDLRLEDWTARGSVASLAAVFAGARFAFVNDSGLAHLAALAGCPTHIVWGAGDPKRTLPLARQAAVSLTLNSIPCWPCEKNQCTLPEGRKLQCLAGIHADPVWEDALAGALKGPMKGLR